MKLYREGTLLKDCLGDLWMVTERRARGGLGRPGGLS